jgi:hypothetical protein
VSARRGSDSLWRPLHLPTVEPDGSCPASPAHRVVKLFGPALGDGPVYAVIPDGGVLRFEYPPNASSMFQFPPGHGWRNWPTATRVQAPGCYAYQERHELQRGHRLPRGRGLADLTRSRVAATITAGPSGRYGNKPFAVRNSLATSAMS